MPHDPYKALYLHIPFCVSRCNYCDFHTQAIIRDNAIIDTYIENLAFEIRRKANEGELSQIETIYIGGGTPSHIGSARLSSLLYMLSLSVDMSAPGFEFSMEANPESIDERLIQDIWALGVNRLSIGVQSFDDAVLSILGRAHDACQAKEAVRTAHSRFDNVSVDIMCGIPGQSIQSLEDSLQTAIELGVSHVSVYPLTIEEHTPLYRSMLAGAFPEPDEDEQAEHMLVASRLLEDAGYARYEVASYAKPGYACKHNCMYWTGAPYLGLGESATTMTQNDERRMRMTDGIVEDDLSRPEMEAEDLMLGMRMACGVSDEKVTCASAYLERLDTALSSLVDDGLHEHSERRWKPTQTGWLMGNELFERLLELA